MIAPHQLYANQEYKVLVKCENEPIKVKFSFESTNGVEGLQDLEQEVELEAGKQKEVLFKIPDLSGDSSYDLVATTTQGDKTYIDVARLKTSNKPVPLLLLQTDRPMYKVGQNVQFRGLVLDRNSHPSQLKTASFYIIDPNGKTIRQWTDVNLDSYGHFKEELHLEPNSLIGYYRLQMKAGDRTSETSFNVLKMEKSRFTVKLDVPSYFSIKNPEIPVVINARYDYGGPVKGKFRNFMYIILS